MGTNGPKFDKESHYAVKTVKQLTAELKEFEALVSEWDTSFMPQPPSRFCEHVQYLRMKIAERIINKK